VHPPSYTAAPGPASNGPPKCRSAIRYFLWLDTMDPAEEGACPKPLTPPYDFIPNSQCHKPVLLKTHSVPGYLSFGRQMVYLDFTMATATGC
jgi:hypothetical protein